MALYLLTFFNLPICSSQPTPPPRPPPTPPKDSNPKPRPKTQKPPPTHPTLHPSAPLHPTPSPGYPYRGLNGKSANAAGRSNQCDRAFLTGQAAKQGTARITGTPAFAPVTASKLGLITALAAQPLVASIGVDASFQHYAGGIWSSPSCDGELPRCWVVLWGLDCCLLLFLACGGGPKHAQCPLLSHQPHPHPAHPPHRSSTPCPSPQPPSPPRCCWWWATT